MSFTAAVHTPSENRLVNENNYRVSAPSASSHFAECVIEAYIVRRLRRGTFNAPTIESLDAAATREPLERP